jgi:ParB-like chromosome segregation protein Spo0J
MAKEKLDKKEAFSRATKAAAERTRAQPKKTITAGRRSAGRITSVPLSQIVLDRYQPRPILPVQDGLRDNFFAGKADWKKTAGQWLELSKSDTGITTQVNGLLEMGKSIGELNQIEPATGAWTEPKPGIYKLLLSTGERRFWSLALSSVSNNQGEPQLAVQEIGPDELSLARQIVENESAKPLSAIGKARAIAGLILEHIGDLPPELDRNSPNPPTDFEYYRAALDIEALIGSKYKPRGMWEEIGEIMGMERQYMMYHTYLLKLPEELQHLADQYELSERALREIMSLPEPKWTKMISLAGKDNLSVPEIKRLGRSAVKKKTKTDSPAIKAASRLKAFWKISKEISTAKDIEQVATELALGMEKKEILAGADVLEKLAQKLRLRAQ